MSHMHITIHAKFLELNTLPYSSKHMHLVLQTCIKKWEFNNLSQRKPFFFKLEELKTYILGKNTKLINIMLVMEIFKYIYIF